MVSGNILIGPQDESKLPKCSFGKLMHDGIKAKNKNDIALIEAFSRSETTYGEVFETTRQLACGFKKLGMGKSDVVAFISETTVHYIYPVLSCLYVGATINPLNPAYSKSELLHAFQITQPRFIICCETVLKTVLSLRSEVSSIARIIVIGAGVAEETIDLNDVAMQGGDAVKDFEPLDSPDIDCEQDVAAILCSSGTTGLPKSVMLTHKNLCAPMTYLHDERYRCIGPAGDTQIGVAPGFHILGLMISLAAVYYNTKLVVMEKFKPDVFLQSIQDYRVNRMIIVPSLAIFLAKSPLVLNYDVSSIKDIVCGAAGLGKDVEVLLDERFKVRVRQCYGMTETSGGITFGPCPGTGIPLAQTVGTAVPGITIKFVDPDTNDSLPAHKPGEIRTKGYMNMKGYMGNDEATRAMFDDEGFLCTGDIGYYDDEGNVFIVDRLKELIKYKGFQVPPTELEDILLSHPEIMDAAVIGIPDERAGELPLAFVVKQPGATVDENSIINYVKGKCERKQTVLMEGTSIIPDQRCLEHISIQKQLHGGVRFINKIPKNSSGKILRRKLRETYQKKN